MRSLVRHDDTDGKKCAISKKLGVSPPRMFRLFCVTVWASLCLEASDWGVCSVGRSCWGSCVPKSISMRHIHVWGGKTSGIFILWRFRHKKKCHRSTGNLTEGSTGISNVDIMSVSPRNGARKSHQKGTRPLDEIWEEKEEKPFWKVVCIGRGGDGKSLLSGAGGQTSGVNVPGCEREPS